MWCISYSSSESRTRTVIEQPPPQALRFSHGRGERETSDWWWTARDHGKGIDGVSFPPSFARTFSSKERRLGTRQVIELVRNYHYYLSIDDNYRQAWSRYIVKTSLRASLSYLGERSESRENARASERAAKPRGAEERRGYNDGSLIKFHLYFAQTNWNTIGWKMTFRKTKLIDNRPSWHPLRLCDKYGSQGDQGISPQS